MSRDTVNDVLNSGTAGAPNKSGILASRRSACWVHLPDWRRGSHCTFHCTQDRGSNPFDVHGGQRCACAHWSVGMPRERRGWSRTRGQQGVSRDRERPAPECPDLLVIPEFALIDAVQQIFGGV